MYKTTVVNGQTVPDQSTLSYYKATLSGTTLSNLDLIWSATGTDQKYDAGDTVDLAITSGWVDDLAEHLLTEHNQDGTHGAVTAASVAATGAVTAASASISGSATTTTSLITDTISERTAASGVTIDGVKLKDSKLATNDSVVTANITNAAVTPAKWTNPYKFSVCRSAAQTMTATAHTKVGFDTETYDSNSNFDSTTNYRYVAPVAGYYHFSANVTVTIDGGSNYFCSLYKNGSLYSQGTRLITTTGTAEHGFVVSNDLLLAANDYIEVFFWNGSGGNKALVNGLNTTYFSGHLISTT